MEHGLVPLLRLVATALCFSAVGADSPPTDGPALHQPELIDPIHQLPAADDLVEVHRGEGGRGLSHLGLVAHGKCRAQCR